MGCCGSSSKKPKNYNNGHGNIERDDDSKTKSVLTWVIVIALIAGLLVWLI